MRKLSTIIIITTILLIILTYNERINASTTTAWNTAQVKVGTCHDDNCSYGSNYDEPHTFSGSALDNPVYSLRWRVKTTNGMSSENTYTFSVAYKPTPDSLYFKEIYFKGDGDVSKENITCTNGIDNSGYYTYKCTFTPLEDYTSSDYLYITINFYQSYQTSLATKISKYEERLGTNAVITQQTNEIIQQSEENTQNIINNIESSTTIINNGIESITENQKVCSLKTIDNKTSIGVDTSKLSSTGQVVNGTSYFITKYFEIDTNSIITQRRNASNYMCFYDNNYTLINCINEAQGNNANYPIIITKPNNAKYVRFTVTKTNANTIYDIYACINGNQAIIDNDHNYTTNNTEINNAIEEEELLKNEIEQYINSGWEDINEITIETEPSNFIWQIITNLKEINQKISVFFLTILSLGVLKMILNR